MSALQAGRYAEARDYLRAKGIQRAIFSETSAVRDAFANWYMSSRGMDVAAAWKHYAKHVLERDDDMPGT